MKHLSCSPLSAPNDAKFQAALNALPDRVAAMRELILEATETGDIAKLRPAIERNEVMPLFGEPGARPRKFSEAIDFLRSRSFDGQGRETLSLLNAILSAPYELIRKKPIDIYVWPKIATNETAAAMAPAIDLFRYTAFADLGRDGGNGRPRLHRVEIGADGTWHFFAAE